jgi:hypothetical protein
MRIASLSVSRRPFLGAMFVLLGWLTVSPAPISAQIVTNGTPGNNAVWSDSTHIAGSAAFIDASVFGSTSTPPDFCVALNNALNVIPSGSAAVIDARGLNLINTTMTCGDSPWANPHTISAPSTVLLPVGPITINKTWSLPDRTRVIGAGMVNSGGSSAGTIIQASSSITSGPMITCSSCNDVSVENLDLNPGTAVTNTIDGIADMSDLNLLSISSTGTQPHFKTALTIDSSASQNSGPYSNLVINHPKTACIKLGQNYTRGIHGMTCIGGPAGILLDSSNGSIEDLHFESGTDGVVVGQDAPAAGNVLFNINGSVAGTNVIHICGPNPPASACSTEFAVKDLALLGVADSPRTVTHAGYTNMIQDDVVGTILAAPSGTTDGAVGMYVLGEQVTDGGSPIGYSRFSTSPNTPTWGVGSSVPGISSCATGALYSNTLGTSGSTLYVCALGGWVAFK